MPFKLLLCSLLIFTACKPSAKKTIIVQNQTFFELKDTFKPFKKSFIDSIELYFGKDFHGTVLIAKDHKIYKKAFGFSNLKETEPMKLDHIFQLASVSKTVTGVGTLLLAQNGKINLDSTLAYYLKDFPQKNVTIRQLLSHRSGLANYMYFTDTFWKDTSRNMTNKDFYSFYCTHTPTPYLVPNACFSYCNTNFALLAILIEKISGLDFPTYIKENIFKPCGMQHSFYYGYENKEDLKNIVTGRFENYQYTEKYYLDGVLGDKSLYSNVEDMFLFHRGLLDGRLLNPTYIELIQTPTYTYNIYGGSYGLGFRLKKYPNGQWLYHNGWWRGFFTFFWNRLDKKACFIIFANNKKSSHIDEQKIGEWLLNE